MRIKAKDPAIHGTAALGRSYWGKLIALQAALQEQQGQHVTLTRRDILEGLIDAYLESDPAIAKIVDKNAPACADAFDKREPRAKPVKPRGAK